MSKFTRVDKLDIDPPSVDLVDKLHDTIGVWLDTFPDGTPKAEVYMAFLKAMGSILITFTHHMHGDEMDEVPLASSKAFAKESIAMMLDILPSSEHLKYDQ